jgi:ribonucleotide reductase beta subunit family protein with ferritin-like domain
MASNGNRTLIFNRRHKMLAEPILTDTDGGRFVAVNRYRNAHKVWQAMRTSAWQVQEVKFEQDDIQIASRDLLPPGVLDIAKDLHAFFVVADGLIGETCVVNIYSQLQAADLRKIYAEQIAMEAVHAEMYRKIAKKLCPNDKLEFERLCQAAKNDPAIKAKIDWAVYHTRPEASFTEQVVSQAIIEGIFFFTKFSILTFFKLQGWLPAVGQANDLISADENIHWMNIAYIIYPLLVNKLDTATFHQLMSRSIDLEIAFIQSRPQCNLPGLSQSQLLQFTQFMGDRMCGAFKYPLLYNVSNPFDWMILASMPAKINFFDRTGAEYNVGQTYADSFDPEAEF